MRPDRLSRAALVAIAASLAWMAVRPHVAPRSVEAAGEAVRVDLERIGGRLLTGGVVPLRCVERGP
jgi:hypothetical protein